MAKQVVRLTESQLNKMIEEAVYNVLTENEEDEGLWNQMKQGAKSFFGNSENRTKNSFRNTTDDRQARGEWTANALNKTTPINLKGRWNAMKTGFKRQGNIDDNDTILSALQQCIDKGWGDLSIKQIMGRLKASNQANKNLISNANDKIYKGMNTGVMGGGNFERY